jgi:hypothetical protein
VKLSLDLNVGDGHLVGNVTNDLGYRHDSILYRSGYLEELGKEVFNSYGYTEGIRQRVE